MADEQWMVRTSMNEVVGPMSRDALIAQIREGKLGLEDEVCKAHSYWIYLDEADEVKRQLGIEMPRAKNGHEDSTETDLQAMTRELSVPVSALGNEDSSDLSESDGGTKILSSRGSQRSAQSGETSETERKRSRFDRNRYRPALGQSQPLILGRVEGPSIWRFIIGALIVLTGVMVAWVIRYLQASP